MVTVDQRERRNSRGHVRTWSLAVALIIGILLAFVSPRPQTASAAHPSLNSVARQLLAVINADRARLHMRPLTLSKRQSSCSRQHSFHMATMGAISHDQFPSDICVSHTWAGENVGSMAADPLTAAMDINQSMMDEGPCPSKKCSPAQFAVHGHYMNLMDPNFTHIGIGLVVQDSTLWLTENFTG